jgi:hypothetical protein
MMRTVWFGQGDCAAEGSGTTAAASASSDAEVRAMDFMMCERVTL